MKLKELIKQAAPLPFIEHGNRILAANSQELCALPKRLNDASEWEYVGERQEASAALMVHAVNILPKLVAALEEIQRACPRYSDDEGINAGLLRIMQVTNGALSDVNNPEAEE